MRRQASSTDHPPCTCTLTCVHMHTHMPETQPWTQNRKPGRVGAIGPRFWGHVGGEGALPSPSQPLPTWPQPHPGLSRLHRRCSASTYVHGRCRIRLDTLEEKGASLATRASAHSGERGVRVLPPGRYQ